MQERKIIIKIAGQKAIQDVAHMDMPIANDLNENWAPKYPNTFGKAGEEGSLASMLANKSYDTNASTIKLKCKDSAMMALDITLPWNQAEVEFSRISRTPEVDIMLAGVVGSN